MYFDFIKWQSWPLYLRDLDLGIGRFKVINR